MEGNKKEKDPNIDKFVLRIEKNLKALADVEAKKNRRSLNGHIVTLIETDLKDKGLLNAKKK